LHVAQFSAQSVLTHVESPLASAPIW
jgi:hypothetical protein